MAEELSMSDSLTSQDPQVGIIMGSRSDWETMRPASEILDELENSS